MHRNKYGSAWSYTPIGCKLCWKGAKLVLFVTGKCNNACWYCPISYERKGKDQIYANERPVKNLRDALREAKQTDAKGMGITGGEPFLAMPKVVNYLKSFKKEFGKKFHAHLYTYGNYATLGNLKKLEKAGLDEIRFHSLNNVDNALKTKMRVGLEVPCIPGTKKYLKNLVDFCAENKIFLNLNEFEFSETNWEKLSKRNFKPKKYSYAVQGSKKLGYEILKYARGKKAKVHFCTVFTKNYLQLTERLKRRAKNIREPWQTINENGMLEYGLVECTIQRSKKLGLRYDAKLKGGECKIETAKMLAKKGFKAWKVIEYPIYKPWIFEKTPLS